ncbi:MAG TPA: hypothetical protein VH143_31550 [Kofleriaceae bacterium]|nr:hypothetical protein [Kofleriaceae bacterium]
MKHIVIAALLLAACGDEPIDTPEVVAKKAQCHALEAHMFRIASQSAHQFDGLDDAAAQKLAESMAAKLPAEDIDQCTAAEPDIVACMTLAPDVRHVRECIPSDDMLACMGKYTDEHDKRHNCGYRYNRDGVH